MGSLGHTSPLPLILHLKQAAAKMKHNPASTRKPVRHAGNIGKRLMGIDFLRVGQRCDLGLCPALVNFAGRASVAAGAITCRVGDINAVPNLQCASNNRRI